MRFWQVKQSINEQQLLEAKEGLEAQHTIHDIQAISNAIPQVPKEEAGAKQKLINQLKQAETILKDFIKKAKLGEFSKEKPTTEAIETEATDGVKRKLDLLSPNPNKRASAVVATDTLDEEAKAVLKSMMDMIQFVENEPDNQIAPEAKKKLYDNLNQILDDTTTKFVSLTQERDSARAERDQAINFVKEVTGVLIQLGNKVQGYTMDKDISGMSSAEKSAYKKMSVNAEKFTKTLKQALFGKILDMQEKTDPEKIKKFLEACVAGKVINMINVIAKDKGSIKDHVNPEFKEVFDVFVEENIFSYAPGTTSGAIGPGEMALSMMGNPAEKGKKGDLKIGDEEVEIKASAKTGGRFNSKKITKATTGWAVWSAKINEIMQSADEDEIVNVKQKDGKIIKIKANKYDGNQYNVIKGKAKQGSKYNWNNQGFAALNAEVIEPYATPEQTADLFISSINALVQNYDDLGKPATNQDGTPNTHHVPFDPKKLIIEAITQEKEPPSKKYPNGRMYTTVDKEKMNIAYSKIAYASYHLADGITTVMLLRTDNLDYTIFRNADDLVEKMKSGNVVTGLNGGSGGFNWNDDQQTPTSGYMSS